MPALPHADTSAAIRKIAIFSGVIVHGGLGLGQQRKRIPEQDLAALMMGTCAGFVEVFTR